MKDVFKISRSGIKTDRDPLFYDYDKEILKDKIKTFYSKHGIVEPFKDKFQVENSSSYKLLNYREKTTFNEKYINNCLISPFGYKYLYYNFDLLSRPSKTTMKHLLNHNNICLLTTRLIPRNHTWNHIFVSKNIVDIHAISDQTYVFPLYLFNNNEKKEVQGVKIPTTMLLFDDKEIYTAKQSNFKPEFIAEMSNRLNLSFAIDTKRRLKSSFTSIDIFDYIYAILHSPSYREKYAEFLKIDFPRVPYPENQKSFWLLVKIGSELRKLHLFESAKLKKRVTTYPNKGSNIVETYTFDPTKKTTGKIWINEKQFFDNVPQIAWNSYIGCYQPAQKWLKDRKGRKLDYDDIFHYQEIIVALTETEKLMEKLWKLRKIYL